MPQLFLASSIDNTINLLSDLAKIEPKTAKVIFVADAADPYLEQGEDISWVEDDKKAFLENGYNLLETDLENLEVTLSDLKSSSQTTPIILHFCGGHTLYLLNKIRKYNLVATIQNLVLTDQVIYTASSAGCMIVAPDLSVKKDLNDEPDTWVKYLSNFTNYTGLDLVDVLIVPHFNNLAYSKYHQEYVANSSFTTPLLFLSDNQAVWVENGKFRIVKK